MGHSSSACTVPLTQRLSAESRAVVETQEIEFSRSRDRARERRAEKQLAEHEAKIPKIRTTDSFGMGAVNGKADAKRKREDQAPVNAPRGPKTARVSEATALQPNGGSRSEQTNAPSVLPRPPAQRPGLGAPPSRPLVQAPTMKKKRAKEDDVFMKKR